jgi:hypothetical protein
MLREREDDLRLNKNRSPVGMSRNSASTRLFLLDLSASIRPGDALALSMHHTSDLLLDIVFGGIQGMKDPLLGFFRPFPASAESILNLIHHFIGPVFASVAQLQLKTFCLVPGYSPQMDNVTPGLFAGLGR